MFFLQGCRSRIEPADADREARELLGLVPGFDWKVDPGSRLADPSNAAFPLPPRDDPDSRRITVMIQEKDAYDDGNESRLLASEKWRAQLPLLENGKVGLEIETAMRLGLLHSPEFQAQKEPFK